MKIILSGGGTLGPVIPLLAIREAVIKKYSEAQFIWVGTKNGPEKQIVEKAGVSFFSIGAGKWRRYFSILNFLDIFKIVVSFFQSLLFVWQEKPDLLISCGGFVSVPLHWAGAILRVKQWVHQQDVKIGLANRLMFPFASKITSALRDTEALLPKSKSEWIGNPSRDLTTGDLISSLAKFNIHDSNPVIFATGGGTGSASINRMVLEMIPNIPAEWHVIHLVGKERPKELMERASGVYKNYQVYEFFTDEMKHAYAVADVVIGRAGFSTLTEAATLSKATVIIPMYNTHQEDNAQLFAEHNGIVMLKKGEDNGLKLAQIVKELISNPAKRVALGDRLHQLLPRPKPEKIVEIFEKLVK